MANNNNVSEKKSNAKAKSAAQQMEEAKKRIADLQAELKAAQEQETAANVARVEEIKGKVEGLCKLFGLPYETEAEMLASLNMIGGYIHGRVKGTLGKLCNPDSANGGERTYKRLTESENQEVDTALVIDYTIANCKRLAEKLGVSFGTVYGHVRALKEAGKIIVAVETPAATK